MGAATAVDPVCKMTVDPATAISAEVDGQTYYFCAQVCRKVFRNDPTAFLGSETGHHGHHHH